MRSEQDEIAHGLQMAAVALVAAVVTATVVIGAGGVYLKRAQSDAQPSPPTLIRTLG